MVTCLDDETMLGLVEGRLAAPVLAAVDDHLDSCPSCRDVIAHLARTRTTATILPTGHALGRYILGELLGEGAMGRVYAAWQPELDRRVALKVLHDDEPHGRMRLFREAQAMARLDHPNVVGVHEVGTTDDGVYVAMELVAGETLRGWAATRHPWRDVVRVLADIARGLHAVHEAGVVHRDVKPDNIIVGTDGRARLGDFGLARGDRSDATAGLGQAASMQSRVDASADSGRDRSPSNDATHRDVSPMAVAASEGTTSIGVPEDDRVRHRDVIATKDGGSLRATRGTALAGTPAYMAPEVLRGASATAASDQFSFGVMAYEILDGKRPFAATTWSELLAAIERGSIPAIARVPVWLDGAIRRCLAIDPARRFASLDAVADHLTKRAQRGRPLVWIGALAAAAAAASSITLFASRDRTAAADPCELGASEIAATWSPAARVRIADMPRAQAAVDDWTAQWAEARDATCRAARSEPPLRTAAREHCLDLRRAELAGMLDRLASHRGDTPASATHRGDPPGAPRAASTVLDPLATDRVDMAGSPRAAATVLDMPTEAELSPIAPLAGTAEARLVDALTALRPGECGIASPEAADPLPIDAERVAAVRAVDAKLPGIRAAIALGDARAILPDAIAAVASARASGHAPTLAEAELVRAEALQATDAFADAIAATGEAIAAAERGRADSIAARAWILRVALATVRRDLASAGDVVPIVDAMIERAGSPPRLLAEWKRLRASIAYNRGDLVEARTLLADARTKFAQISGERSIDVALAESALGVVARAAGDLDEAERRLRAAFAIDRALRGERHPDLARDLHNIAGILRLRGDLAGAQRTYEDALAIDIANHGARSAAAGLTHNSLGLVHLARKDLVGARAEFELARDLLGASGLGDRAFAEHNLGITAAAAGDHRAALEHYAAARTIYTTTIGDTAAPSARLVLDTARSLAALADPKARAQAQAALDAAERASIPWLADDARALLAKLPASPGSPRPRPPVTPPKSGTPQPPRDVGVYGPRQP